MLLQKILGPKAGKKNPSKEKSEKAKKKYESSSRNHIGDRDNKHNSIAVTSCTSGLNNMSLLDIQQRLPWNKNHVRKSEKTDNDELVEISEEYDIQSVISGLTRNSQFIDAVDPPASGYEEKTILDQSSQWPDDETCGKWPDDETRGNHSIRITVTNGNELESEDVIRPQRVDDESRSIQRINVIVSPEPDGRRLESPIKEILSSGHTSSSNYRASTGSDRGLPGSAEPDGMKLGTIRPKIPVEPSGQKLANRVNRNSNRRFDEYLPGAKDTGTISMGIDELSSGTSRLPFSRGRSKSTNATRRTQNEMNPMRKKKGCSDEIPSDDISYLANDVKRRSRSVPSSRKQYSVTNRESQKMNFEGQESTSEKRYSDERELNAKYGSRKSFSVLLTENVVGITEDEIVSSLGSQCDGCESEMFQQGEARKVRSQYLSQPPPKISSQSTSEIFEPRVCVDFSRRESGGYFPTTSYPDQNYHLPGQNKENERGEGELLNHVASDYSTKGMMSKTKNPLQRMANQENSSRRPHSTRKAGKSNARMIAERASRSSLLGKCNREDSLFDELDVFGEVGSFSCSSQGPEERQSKYNSTSVALSRTTDFHDVVSDPKAAVTLESSFVHPEDKSPLSMTSAGRKQLIQRYLSLREKDIRISSSIISCTSSTKEEGRCKKSQHKGVSSCPKVSCISPGIENDGITDFGQSSVRKQDEDKKGIGYDDASRFYPIVVSPESFSPERSNTMTHLELSRGKASNLERKLETETKIHVYEQSSISSSQKVVTGGTFLSASGYNGYGIKNENFGELSSEPCLKPQHPNFSFCSDDDSSTGSSSFDAAYRLGSTNKYTALSQWDCDNGLNPHNQFLRMQLGLGSS